MIDRKLRAFFGKVDNKKSKLSFMCGGRSHDDFESMIKYIISIKIRESVGNIDEPHVFLEPSQVDRHGQLGKLQTMIEESEKRINEKLEAIVDHLGMRFDIEMPKKSRYILRKSFGPIGAFTDFTDTSIDKTATKRGNKKR